MDDYDDIDEFGREEFDDSEDFDEEDELDEELDEESDEAEDGMTRDLGDLEDLGVMDGQQDAIAKSYYTGFGVSVDDFDSLSEEEKGAYEMGYMTGYNAGGGWE
ncbi:hypothetical protein IJG27_01480 [Candidatus Saccharibacteria bacterium]|nr:hypothetical protein [Candidatus Saccharibacteria bacterium]